MDCGLGADRAGSLELRRRRARPRFALPEPVRLSAARRVEDVARAAQIVVLGGGERGGGGRGGGRGGCGGCGGGGGGVVMDL